MLSLLKGDAEGGTPELAERFVANLKKSLAASVV